MPNTLAHIGFQGIASRSVFRSADFRWILLGCIIPDVAWILNRAAKALLPGIDLFDLRLYSMVQSSLFISLMLCMALAVLAVQVGRTFILLGFNSILHLLLDATQIKWANGVHLLAPFNWKLTTFNWYWPEGVPSYLLTLLGLLFLVIVWRRTIAQPLSLAVTSPLRWSLFVLLSVLYFALPFLFMTGPQKADNHFVQTLRNSESRSGKYVEIDRGSFSFYEGRGEIAYYGGERIEIEGVPLKRNASLSIRGVFITNDRIRVEEYHIHHDWLRDGASYLGLSFIGFLWIFSLFKQHRAS
ncbi:MAG: hypothetical protein Kow0042_18010 [Calditrichia bacterium]